jgi:hypothetical protein
VHRINGKQRGVGVPVSGRMTARYAVHSRAFSDRPTRRTQEMRRTKAPAGFWITSFVLIHYYLPVRKETTHIVFERVQFAVNLIYCGYLWTKNGAEVRPRKFICVRAHALLCPGAGIAP